MKKTLFLLALNAIALCAFSQFGELDANFGTDGIIPHYYFDDGTTPAYIYPTQDSAFFLITGGSDGEQDGYSLLKFKNNGTTFPQFGDAKELPIWGWKSSFYEGQDGLYTLSAPVFEDSLVLNRFNLGGQFDTNFGNDGDLKIYPSNTEEVVSSQFSPSSEDFMVISRLEGETNKISISRYYLDGSLNTDFGDEGQLTIFFPNIPEEFTYFRSIKELSDNGFMLNLYANTLQIYIKVKEDGTIDTNFGENGIASADMLQSTLGEVSNFTILYPSMQYLGTINTTQGNITHTIIARFQPDGTLDETFGTNGYTYYDAGDERCLFVLKLIQPDGKMIFTGSVGSYDTDGYFLDDSFILRLNENGTFDSTFGENGIFRLNYYNHINNVIDFNMLSNGDFVFTGVKSTPTGGSGGFLAKLTSGLQLVPENEEIEEETDPVEANIGIHPNPVSDEVIYTYETIILHQFTYQIHNTLGEAVLSQTHPEELPPGKHTFSIDVQHLPKGVYYLVVGKGIRRTVNTFYKF